MSFFRRNKERIIVIVVAIILIIAIGATSKERGKVSKLENVMGKLFSPVTKLVNNLSNKVSNKFMNIKNVFTLKEENEKLKEEILVLKAENRRFENIVGKNEYLQKHYELLKNTNYELKEASVIGKDPGYWFDIFTIDKGINEGVKVGDAVIQAVETEEGTIIEGLAGRVTEVGDDFAKVVTIIDELSSLSFKVLRTQDGGVISGSHDGEISGYLFDMDSDVIKGDKIYTSGLGGIFKEDLYVGTVKEVRNDEEEMVKTISVDPALNFKKIYTVYVLPQ